MVSSGIPNTKSPQLTTYCQSAAASRESPSNVLLIQVILLMPTGDGSYRPSSTVYADPQTKSVIDRIQRDSFDLFNDYSVPAPVPPPPRKKPPMLAAMKENV